MTINAATGAELGTFNANAAQQTDTLNSMPSLEDQEALAALEQGYIDLAISIVKSTGSASWTGWNWRENDQT